ncbi:hypothetical protein WER97_11395 [Staphylococcus felis]|uniref:hypothetical protein n=1 Tax=Staphylococcus felis TaxID=46127 RepID=UPI0039673D2B
MEKWNDGEMKLTVYDLTNIKNDIRKYLISESDIYVDGDKLYDVVIEIEDYKSERDTLIDDIAKLRKERDDLKRNIDEYVFCKFEAIRHINQAKKEGLDYCVITTLKSINDKLVKVFKEMGYEVTYQFETGEYIRIAAHKRGTSEKENISTSEIREFLNMPKRVTPVLTQKEFEMVSLIYLGALERLERNKEDE